MTEPWSEIFSPLHLRVVRRDGRAILLPMLEGTHYVELFALGYLALADKEPLNTRLARYQAVAHVRLACIVAGIERPEYRLSYETGLSEPELRAINILTELPVEKLRCLTRKKAAGVSLADLEAICSTSTPLSNASQIVRKTYVIDYLQRLMEEGDGVLSRYIVPEGDIALRRIAYKAIEECITIPERVGRYNRCHFDGYQLACLEDYLEKFDPWKVWPNPTTALRNAVMFDLQFYGGLRRSEVLALKWEDIVPRRGADYPPQIKVAARRNDPDDPRARPPVAKTGPGTVTVPDYVFKRLDTEWREAWDEIEERAYDFGCEDNMDHNFVFVTTAVSRRDVFGAPLSLSGYDSATKALCASCGMPAEGLSSHALRHLCAMRYVRRRRDRGDSNDEIRKGMREFFRWSITSNMPDYYTANEDHAHIYDDMIQDAKFLAEM